jgi:hypothetical protein
MRRALTPLWLASPSRWATMSRPAARAVLALLALVSLLALTALSVPGGQADSAFYAAIVEGVRHGGDYYAVAADALRAGGYPLAPFVAFRLPTLAVIEAAVPSFAVMTMLYLLAAAVAATWYGRLAPSLKTRGARTMVAVLLFASLAPILRPSFALLPESWAGLFIALSLAVRRPGHAIDAIAFGLAAATIRETAALYLVVMAVFALSERQRREALGWALALAILAIILLFHAHAVAGVVKPLDNDTVAWTGWLGFGAFVSAAVSNSALTWIPLWLGAPIVAIALFGWTTWRDPLALRALATIALVAAMIAIFGQPDTPHWALLVTPLLLPGLMFAVDGLRDLYAAVVDTRRITVTRITR